MAKKPRAPKEKASQSAFDDALVTATLDEAAAMGWREVTIAGVASRAQIPLGAVLEKAPTKAHLALGVVKAIDRATMAGVTEPDPPVSAKDRLFDVIMRRFDAMNKHREGTRAMVRGVARDPGAAVMLGCRVQNSAAMMLGAAGIGTDGICGQMRIQGLKAIMLSAVRAWMKDDTADLAETMAAVDRALNQAERLLKFMPSLRSRPTEAKQA